jgi:hypothetical protein
MAMKRRVDGNFSFQRAPVAEMEQEKFIEPSL